MAKNLWRNLRNNWQYIGKQIENDLFLFAVKNYQYKLEELVSVFETLIMFETIVYNEGGDRIVKTQPKPGLYTTNRVKDSIETATLFKYLDEGTDTNYAVMPSDFANETFVGTLSSVGQRYNRRRIYLEFDGNRYGIQGRQWLRVLEEMMRAKLANNVQESLEKIVKVAVS